MGHPLDGCIAKIDRADVQIRALERSRESFIQGDSYTGRIDHDPQSSEPIMRGHIQRRPGAVSEDRAALRWGSVIGETVHDLRSALDGLVWQLTELEQGAAPDPIKGQWRQIAFPIEIDPAKWPPVPNSLWGIRPGLSADFKALQPFDTRQDAPEREPLAVLHELWIIDKHRHIHVARRLVRLEAVRLVPVDSARADFTLPDQAGMDLLITSKSEGIFEDGAELGRLAQTISPTALEEMYVEADVAADIAFDQGPPAYGAYVTETLERMTQTCRVIIEQFRPEFA
jgi:hypothetical protein